PTGTWKLGVGALAITIGMVAVTVVLVPVRNHRRAQMEEAAQVVITSTPPPAEPLARDPAPPAPAPPEPLANSPAAVPPADIPPPADEPLAPPPAAIQTDRLVSAVRRAVAAAPSDPASPRPVTMKRRPARRSLPLPPPPDLAPGRAFSLGADP